MAETFCDDWNESSDFAVACRQYVLNQHFPG